MRKIKYQNWIYEILNETSPQFMVSEVEPPSATGEWVGQFPPLVGEGQGGVSATDPEIAYEVRKAVAKLSEKERIFVEQFYFEGKSHKEIGQILKLNLKQVEYLQRKAVFKLENLLAEFVAKRFKMRIEKPSLEKSVNPDKKAKGCVICQSPKQKEIERLIESKKDYQTWGVILKKLKSRFDLDIKAPHILMGHMKHKVN